MNTSEFVHLAWRRWYVVVAGLLGTIAMYHVMASGPDVYTARTTLVVLAPTTDNPNTLQVSSPVSIASIAVITVNKAPNQLDASSDDATLVGEGVTHGVQVRLRNQGSQWAPMAPNPYIDIDAVDSSVPAVEQRLQQSRLAVISAIRSLEGSLDVAPNQRVSITETPTQPAVTLVARSNARALLGSLLVGGGATITCLLLLGRLRPRRTAQGASAAQQDERVGAH